MIHLLFSFFISAALAGGMMSLKGELEKPCTQTDCRIKIGRQLYIVDLTKLSKNQIEDFKSKKISESVSEFIPLSAVKDVKDIE